MSARKAKKRAHVSDSDHDSAEDEHPEVASITFPQFSEEFSSWDAFHEELTRYVFSGWPNLTFKPRGKGSRTNHNIRSNDCPAKLSAVLVQSGDGSYKVRVSKHIATHNHDVGRDVYYSYAEARKITSPGTRGVVKTLVQGGSKKKKILRYLKEVSGKPVLPKDVENLVAKMRKETYTSEDDNERVAQVLRDFSEGPGNAGNVFRDKETEFTSCITFQTAHMRRMTRKFPETICLDATYGTNINRYRLFSFMVTNKFGFGSFAQHALVDGESKLNMLCAIRLTELALLHEEFPCATVILCHFHVIDYLKREVSKKDYGFSAFEKMHIKNILTMLITNVGEPIPAGEDVTNSDDAGEDVTNSNDAGDNVTNSYDASKDDTNSGSVLTPDSTPEIKIETGARVELTSTPASARRKLDLDSVGSALSDEEIVNIVLNTASRPAGRPRGKKAVKKAKRR
ncbi:hypothetical protein PC117_g6049 [Phytophthora cactorum]|uniref:ZSWIM1/3 RNaseH-like domain-containing protein n=1 Tax=Phytophthora cactorum TaxID=29920 RepID=A0A8T1E4I4_9STRA|nr:hypothetical protein PC117_g6049 [Phytophthora cactorum]